METRICTCSDALALMEPASASRGICCVEAYAGVRPGVCLPGAIPCSLHALGHSERPE
jgi:hypothetical protein